jgi:hypothetical protein
MTSSMPGLRTLLMGAITLGVIGAATGCGGGGAHGPTTPVGTTAHVEPAPAPVSAGTQLYDGQAFAITYPGGWWVHEAEQPKSFGTATRILDPSNHARSVRIDVRPTPAPATPLIDRIRRRPGYRELGLQRLTFEGHDALLWDFVVDQGGRAVRKQALSFTDHGGRGIRIVTQAPARQYARWAQYFAATRGSYLPY